jgi:hypothetical protein
MKNNKFGCKYIRSVCETKRGISFHGGKENNGWYLFRGRKAVRIAVPKGRQTVPVGTYKSSETLIVADQEKLASFIPNTLASFCLVALR